MSGSVNHLTIATDMWDGEVSGPRLRLPATAILPTVAANEDGTVVSLVRERSQRQGWRAAIDILGFLGCERYETSGMFS